MPSLRLPVVLAVTALALMSAREGAAQQSLDVYAFLDKLRAVVTTRQGRIETASILNTMPLIEQSYLVEGDARTRCYFDFGDVHRFVELAAKGLKGVVVDPGYMDGSGHGDAMAIYQNVNTFTIALSRYEAKYNGFIVLRSFTPAPGNDAEDSTQLHEAIHALAFGTGRIDLDQDGAGADAPEYISKSFFDEQRFLLRLEERALTDTKAELEALDRTLKTIDQEKEAEVNAAIARHVGAIHAIAADYLAKVERIKKTLDSKSDHSWEKVHALMGLWGGKADWDGLIAHTRENVALLSRASASAGQDAGGEISLDPLLNFFFKTRCIPE